MLCYNLRQVLCCFFTSRTPAIATVKASHASTSAVPLSDSAAHPMNSWSTDIPVRFREVPRCSRQPPTPAAAMTEAAAEEDLHLRVRAEICRSGRSCGDRKRAAAVGALWMSGRKGVAAPAISPYYWFRWDGGGWRAWGGGEIGDRRTGGGREGRRSAALGVRFFCRVRHSIGGRGGRRDKYQTGRQGPLVSHTSHIQCIIPSSLDKSKIKTICNNKMEKCLIITRRLLVEGTHGQRRQREYLEYLSKKKMYLEYQLNTRY